MNKLGEKSLKTLEYYEILEKLAGQAASQAAKEKCRALRPLDDHEQAELWLQQTTDAKDLMVRQGSPAFGGIREVGAILSRADRGGTLNPRELLAVASLLQTARRALLYDAEHEEPRPRSRLFSVCSPATATWRNPSRPPSSPRRRSRTVRLPSCCPSAVSCAACPARCAKRSTA